MEVPKPWLYVKEAAPILNRSRQAIYEQIRRGIFPFRYKRAGKTILISAADLELTPPQTEAAREGDQSFDAAAPAHA